ncbi:hypothetical protein G9A89_021474 [Geosiphon pyriformis]|nr:hypothetical protein G9A89_021474 [Geosiphon pyriformis]
MSLIPEKKRQDLQNPKPTPYALTIPSNLTIPDESTKRGPEIEAEMEPSCGISPLFSIKAQCLVWTSQKSSQKAMHKLCTKLATFRLATLESLKTETALLNQLMKTKLLHRAVQIAASEAQVASNCETHKNK